MKLSMILLAAALLAGCATKPPTATDCVLLKFPQSPTPALVQQLAGTQPAADRQAIYKWFCVDNERSFILRGSHTNEIAAALAEGATATVIHRGGSTLNNNAHFGEQL